MLGVGMAVLMITVAGGMINSAGLSMIGNMAMAVIDMAPEIIAAAWE